MQYLILGANGYIGAFLYCRLKMDGKTVTGTGHIHNSSDEYLFFDILKDNIQNVIHKMDVRDKEKTAIVCIAQPNISLCYDNYNLSYEINVVKTKELIRCLREHEFHVIFFSTDNVFDGKEGAYTEESKTHAINKYGMMKAEMEQYLTESEPDVCIFRISKVVSTERLKQNILLEWENQCREGIVRCIKGNRLSFVAAEDIYQSCLIAAQRKLRGIYHIAGDQAYSRAELAELFFKKAGNISAQIQECSVQEFSFTDGRPLDISMNNMKFKRETDYQFTSMGTVIDEYLKNSRK